MFDLSRYTDRKHLKRRNGRNNAGWQFATKKRGFEETKFFGDATYGSADESYAAALEYRNQFLAVARELGIADESGITTDRLPINLTLGVRNNSGINGVNRHSRALRRNRKTREEFWVANHKDEAGNNQQEEFGINARGEKDALYHAVEFRRDYVRRVRDTLADSYYRERIDNHLVELAEILECIAGLDDPADVFLFVATLNNPMLSSTQKQEMISIRIGQRRFRRVVLDYWQHKCVVTHSTMLLTAGHIKPWAHADDNERIDVFNGLALSPVYDKAFDGGFISFRDDGAIMVSAKLKPSMLQLKVTGKECISSLDPRHHEYLQWHRSHLFRDG